MSEEDEMMEEDEAMEEEGDMEESDEDMDEEMMDRDGRDQLCRPDREYR